MTNVPIFFGFKSDGENTGPSVSHNLVELKATQDLIMELCSDKQMDIYCLLQMKTFICTFLNSHYQTLRIEGIMTETDGMVPSMVWIMDKGGPPF